MNSDLLNVEMSARNTFCKTERVLNFREFRKVYDKGERYSSRFFLLFVHKRAESAPGSDQTVRLGVTVTKKVGNAVQRNRCKRILREIFRHRKSQMKGGFDLVFNVKRSMLEASFQEVEAEFSRLISLALRS